MCRKALSICVSVYGNYDQNKLLVIERKEQQSLIQYRVSGNSEQLTAG